MSNPTANALATVKVQVPKHVVFRSFPTETVVLNLETGRYHGLNPTAGRMLKTLAEAGEVRRAASIVAREYGRPQAAIEADLCSLCQALLSRGLVEVDRADPRAPA
jgi:hypothetical protein